MLRLPAAYLPVLRSASPGDTIPESVVSLPRAADALCSWAGRLGDPALPRAGVSFRMETTGPPRFPGDPPVHMPCSLTPAGPPRPAILGVPMLPSAQPTASAPASSFAFGAPSHSLRTPCVRFTSTVARCRATRGSGCWPALPGGIGYPTGPIERFHRQDFLSAPPFLSFPGAPVAKTLGRRENGVA